MQYHYFNSVMHKVWLKLYIDFLIISKQNMLAMNCENNNNIIILFKETIHDPTQLDLRPKLSEGECSSSYQKSFQKMGY